MKEILFVTSAVCAIFYVAALLGGLSGNKWSVPMPIGHFFNCGYGNAYVYTYGIGYQVYFWSIKLAII